MDTRGRWVCGSFVFVPYKGRGMNWQKGRFSERERLQKKRGDLFRLGLAWKKVKKKVGWPWGGWPRT